MKMNSVRSSGIVFMLMAFCFVAVLQAADGKISAFPGAEGFGSTTPAGILVLDDTPSPLSTLENVFAGAAVNEAVGLRGHPSPINPSEPPDNSVELPDSSLSSRSTRSNQLSAKDESNEPKIAPANGDEYTPGTQRDYTCGL